MSAGVVRELGLTEGWRITRHPVALAGLAASCLMIVLADGQKAVFEATSGAITFFFGVSVFFAANLVATRDRRAGTSELVRPAPAGSLSRAAGACLACLVPALVAAAVVATAYAGFAAADRFLIAPSFWQTVQGPITVLGAALLGVAVARWAPRPGVPLVVMMAVVAWSMYAENRPMSLSPLSLYTTWAAWGDTPSAWAGTHPGSAAWHVGYLLALCGLAATAALLRAGAHRARLLLAGAAFAAAAVGAGWSALP